MKEKVLVKSKNGMVMLLLFLLLYIAAIAGFIFNGIKLDSGNYSILNMILMVVSALYTFAGWILFLGLKVLKPQEALVLTLFGQYVGTLKDAGFYFVNPFCSAINPAAATKLNQSGDVTDGGKALSIAGNGGLALGASSPTSASTEGKKISLKIMTLNNARQKVNDCLGNPIEIGIAVMWRVTDTAKAVFNVDNYKEYLSLQ